jgi:ribonuclease HI
VKLKLHSDGASRGNPGEAGAGAVLVDGNGNVVAELSRYIGKATCNVAEYRALIMGLEEAFARGATEVECRTDSELMAKQLTGVYKVKSPHLRKLASEALDLAAQFEKFSISHVARGKNCNADSLANQAISMHGPGGKADRPSGDFKDEPLWQQALDVTARLIGQPLDTESEAAGVLANEMRLTAVRLASAVAEALSERSASRREEAFAGCSGLVARLEAQFALAEVVGFLQPEDAAELTREIQKTGEMIRSSQYGTEN